jgi:hypothetical protein
MSKDRSRRKEAHFGNATCGTGVARPAPMPMRGLLARAILTCSFLGAACGRPDAEGTASVGASPAATSATSAEEPATVPRPAPLRIFHDLTGFDWYRRGEPLVYNGRAYQPSGPPVRAEAGTMTKIGEYGGVDIYAHAAPAEDGALYVPVYEDYGLAFIASGEENGPPP